MLVSLELQSTAPYADSKGLSLVNDNYQYTPSTNC